MSSRRESRVVGSPTDLPSPSQGRNHSDREKSHNEKARRSRRSLDAPEAARHHSRSEHRRQRHRHHDRDRDQRRESPIADGRELIKYEASIPKTVAADAEEPLFVLDNRGDPLIVRYGTNDRARVPDYRRTGSGRLLGASGYLHVSRDGTREAFSIRGPRDSGSIFRDKHNPLLLRAAQVRSRRVRQQQAPVGSEPDLSVKQQDFISLGPARKRKRSASHGSISSTDEDSQAYRSIQGKARPDQPSDSDLEYDSDAAPQHGRGDAVDIDPIMKRSIELSRNVKEHPEDIESWLELVALQNDLLFGGDQELTAAEAKSLADIKLSLLESAVKNAQTTADRETVLFRLMREGSKVWDTKNLARRWQDITKEHSESFWLWKARLDFETSNPATSTYDYVKQFHLDKLRSLKEHFSAALLDSTGKAIHLCGQLIYVLLRTTRFVQDAGYTEMAIATWQAFLELAFSRPQTLKDATPETILTSFGDHWESEVARIGEDSFQGWAYLTGLDDVPDVPDAKRDQTMEQPRTRDVYKAWAITEQQHASKSSMPGRTLDNGSDLDPFRVVMFADIQELQFIVPPTILPDVQCQIIDAFLLFCQLPPAFCTSSFTESAWRDPFIFTGSSSLPQPLLAGQDPAQQQVERRQPDFAWDGATGRITSDILFGRPCWFDYPGSLSGAPSTECTSVDLMFTSTAVRQLVRMSQIEPLAEYSLALDWIKDPTTVKKAAKALIKLFPSNVELYNAYALAEHANGNIDIAHKVLASATSQKLGSELHSNQLLWFHWAWLELGAGKKEEALLRLCASVDESSTGTDGPHQQVTPSQLLKTRQTIAARRDHQLSTGHPDVATCAAQAFALLEYLSAQGGAEPASESQGNISAAMTSVTAFSNELTSRGHDQSAAHERLLQFAARLLYFHATHGPYRPIYLREHLLAFIRLFPRNTIFLSLFAWAESGSARIDDPVRAVLRTVAPADECLATAAFAIRHEARVGNAHSVRAAFERALRGDALGSGAPSLWRDYVRFCRGSKELRARAKDVFYRGVHACPWSKELIMEAFSTVVGDMDSSELRAVFNAISEKGLRVHVELSEYVERWKEEQKGRKK